MPLADWNQKANVSDQADDTRPMTGEDSPNLSSRKQPAVRIANVINVRSIDNTVSWLTDTNGP